MTLPILTAVTGDGEAALVAGLGRPGGPVHVVRRCADLAEVLSAAAAGLARAAVISADLERLDREAVAQLAAAGVVVVALVPGAGKVEQRLHRLGVQERLRRLGVEHVLPETATADEVAAAVLLASVQPPDATARAGAAPSIAVAPVISPAALPSGTRVAVPAQSSAPPSGGFPPVRVEEDDPLPHGHGLGGRIVAVWGPVGAPGRTTLAVTLASELARTAPVLLVDADTYGASIAQTLGLLDESAGLAAAARAANQGALDDDRLARLAPVVHGDLRVLTGLPRPSRWPELRPSALDVVWARSRSIAAWTVVDCGFALETDEEVMFDVAAPRRNGATLSALAAADLVVAVGGADPLGLQRLVRGLTDLSEVLPPNTPVRAVVNRVRASAVGGSPQRRVTEAVERYAGVRPVLVPDDRDACDAALLAGRSLTEHAPRSPARRAVADLAALLAAETAAL